MRKRWLHPNSTSGLPGVRLLPDSNPERIFSSHSNDPLNDGHAHDAFDCFRILEHGGDFKAAVREAARLLGMETQPSKATQTDFNGHSSPSGGNDDAELFDLDSFALNGQSGELEKQLVDDKFILGRIAILGQATVIYAPPNTGKTLLMLAMLRDGIISGEVDASSVYFVNADDHFKGALEKLKLAEKHGFKMLVPSHNGFKAETMTAIPCLIIV